MTRLIPFFAMFGLFTPKAEDTDVFTLRLTRMGNREARARSLGLTFRNQSQRPAAATLS